jgi:hypothetical protein
MIFMRPSLEALAVPVQTPGHDGAKAFPAAFAVRAWRRAIAGARPVIRPIPLALAVAHILVLHEDFFREDFACAPRL